MKKFTEDYNTAVFTTKFVLFDKKDITWVYHFKEDGAWQFSSDDEFENFEEVAKIASLGEIIELDNTVLDLVDLPEGYCAHRHSRYDKWAIKPFTEK